MAISNALVLRQAVANAFETTVGSGGLFSIYAGTVPANADTALAIGTTHTLLAQATVPSAAFMTDAASSSPTASLTSTLSDTSANATGTMSFYRWETSAGACVQQGTITVTGGGGDITFSSLSVTAGQTVNLTAYTQTGS